MAINKNGSYGSKATARELAELYGNDTVKLIQEISDVHSDRWGWFQGLIYQQASIAASFGRKALRHPGPHVWAETV